MRPLPTRVLDLGGETPSLNIYESRNELGRYGCLSHCWGSSQPVITESSNLDRHKERVEWSALPKTFQDAISFARYLQIRFLWIDSLCIIQDNEADWQRESAKMASIYQNAYVVLAATRSSNADGGCFSKTHTEYQAHEQFPLLTRAWTYQELLLGARIVHFAEHELVWECQESTRCQCGGVKTDVYPLERYSRLAKRWRAIVEEYSKLKLTCEKDKLPALSGLARYMQQYRTDRYLAGLWEDELPISLLWRPTEPGRTYRPSKYTAPSWSWASVVGKIYF
ncbi:HET-domain-containing protein, partial [Lepidopterella palustris CBS 459.81]